MPFLSINPTRKWQPIPINCSLLSSGNLVDELCGQPEQKYGVRSTVLRGTLNCLSVFSNTSIHWVMESVVLYGCNQLTNALEISAGVNSPLDGNCVCWSRPFLPITNGRIPIGISNKISFTCVSRNGRDSSITRISSTDSANSRTKLSSIGQITAILKTAKPSSSRIDSSMDKSSKASRVSR